MQKLLDKFNVDLTGLENLLKGVVAYVEVRTGTEDISYDIAREMKEIGATISDSRNSSVTHVIFREGTLRTSNWAKRHKVPLIDIGWLAACTRYRENLHSRPWHVNYLVESVDIFGDKKKMKYKKYFKNMNIEEFEAELERSKERRKKQMTKQLNNSKSDVSFDANLYDSPENERIMKRSDPMCKLRTPEIVKRYQARHERFKQTGRYSWESDDEIELGTKANSEKMENSSTQPETQTNIQSIDDEEQSNIKSIDNDKSHSNENIDSSISIFDPVIPRQKLKSRRLFKDINISQDSLIEPVHKSERADDLVNILPKAVQKGINGTVRKSVKRSSTVLEDKKPSKKSCSSPLNDSFDISLPKKKPKVIPKNSIANLSPILPPPSTPVKKNLKSERPLSPLVTEHSSKSPILKSPNIFFTPKNKKRTSLRTRVLKQSAKKKYRQSQLDGSFNSFNNVDMDDPATILVPQSAYGDRRMNYVHPVNVETVLETPNMSVSSTDINNNIGDSFTSSVIANIIDTPNMSKLLDNLIPNRQKPESYDHILFIPKVTYDHCTRATLPDFKAQKKYISDNIVTPSNRLDKERLIEMTGGKNYRVTRKSARISNRLSNLVSPPKQEGNEFQNPSIILDRIPGIESTISSRSSISNKKVPIENCKQLETDLSSYSPLSISLNDPSPMDTENRLQIDLSKAFPSDDSRSADVHTIDPPEMIFKPGNDNNKSSTPRRNIRRSTRLSQFKTLTDHPMTELTDSTSQPIKSNIETINRKRPWSKVESQKLPAKTTTATINNQSKKNKLFRDSSDSFITGFPPIVNKKQKRFKVNTEIVLVGFTNIEEKNIKSICKRLPGEYKFIDVVRSKEQLVIVPEKPKKSIEIINALVFGNTFVKMKWIDQSIESKMWLDLTPFIIKETELFDLEIIPPRETTLFSEYSSMYISQLPNGIPKYKLRVIIEIAGGKVTDSFRQAGIVINTRKINALSVKENWILDSIKEGKALNPKNYMIL